MGHIYYYLQEAWFSTGDKAFYSGKNNSNNNLYTTRNS